RGLFSHVTVAAGENNAVDLLNMGGQNRQRRPEFGTELRKLDASPAGDFGQPDLFKRMIGEQRHQRIDRLIAVGTTSRWGRGRTSARTLGLAGHDGLP